VDILDKASRPGGMLSHAIPGFRLPDDIVMREIDGLTLPGMRFQGGKALGHDFTIADLERDYACVFLAPGLWSGQGLKIPGMDRSETTDALGFLTSCRTKGMAEVGEKVLVIGGGSVASDAALSAKHFGAVEVTLVCLEGPEKMPCLKSEIDIMKHRGVRIENGWGPKELACSSKMRFVGCTSVLDDRGRFHPVFNESRTMEVDFDQLIPAVGQCTEPSLARYLEQEFGRGDRLQVDGESLQLLNRDGVFAGGDIVRGAGTVVEAVADGRRAAMGMDRFLRR